MASIEDQITEFTAQADQRQAALDAAISEGKINAEDEAARLEQATINGIREGIASDVGRQIVQDIFAPTPDLTVDLEAQTSAEASETAKRLAYRVKAVELRTEAARLRSEQAAAELITDPSDPAQLEAAAELIEPTKG